MSNIDTLDNKDFPISQNHDDLGELKNRPIKKCHCLDGRYFIVIDELILRQLKLSGDDIYFYQEVSADNILILRPFKIK